MPALGGGGGLAEASLTAHAAAVYGEADPAYSMQAGSMQKSLSAVSLGVESQHLLAFVDGTVLTPAEPEPEPELPLVPAY